MGSKVEQLQSQTEELETELQSMARDEKKLSEKVESIEVELEARALSQEAKKMVETITKTYLTLWFSSEGKSPTSVVVKLQEIGFRPTTGEHDFVYDWKQETELRDLFKLGDAVRKTLRGSKVFYRLETV